jgi:hypothetical protein
VITSFNLTPTAIAAGQTAQLTAVFSNGTARVEPGGLSLASGVPTSVSPAATTTYVLTVTGASGTSLTQSQTLSVYPVPVITSLGATPATITAGGSANLTAQFSGGTGLITPGNLPISSGTPVAVSPSATTQYTLTVTPPAGTPVTRTATVNVVPAAVISNFSATPASVREGNGSTLAFAFSGGTGLVTPGNVPVTSGGSLAVTPASTTTYTLTVTNAAATSTSAQATVTVVPRPVLTSTAPAQVGAGQTLSFQVSGKDEFGVALGPYVLDFGPAGMAVTAEGTVTWQAKAPMFSSVLDVAWQVSVPSYPGVKLAGTTQVSDPIRGMPLRRFGIEIPVWNSGLVVTDLDGDGKQEMLVASKSGLAINAWNGALGVYEIKWAYPWSIGPSAPLTAVAARDLDGDGKSEIFMAAGNSLVRLEGTTRREVARYTGAAAAVLLDVEVADLDSNGSLELVCLEGTSAYSTTSRLVVFDALTMAEQWRSADLPLRGTLAVGNVDTDPNREIVTAGGYVFDGVTHANEWAYGPGFGRAAATGDLDGDGVDEIVGMEDWDRFKGYSAILKSPVWEKTGFDFDALLVQDMDGDGKAEIFVGDGQWGNVTGYKYFKNTNSLLEVFKVNSQDHGVTSLAMGDVDGDGSKELVWGSGSTSSGADVLAVASLASPGAIEWTNANPKQLDGPFVGGLLGRTAPGVSRLIYAVPSTNSGYAGTRLLALDPVTGSLGISKEWGSNWSRAASLAVADVTGAGIDRALLTTANFYDGYMTAVDVASDTAVWTSAANLGTSIATLASDMNSDGFADMVSITSQGYVYVHDVRNGTLVWKSTGLGTCSDGAVADLDNDGVPEILALTSTRLVAFKRGGTPGTYLELHSHPLTDGRGLLVSDLDGDGQPELVILGGSAGSNPAKLHRLDKAFQFQGTTVLTLPVSSIHLEDYGNGRKNIVVSVPAAGSEGPHLRGLDPKTGVTVWRSPSLWGTVPSHSLHYVDVDKNGFKHLSFGTSQGMYLTR